MRLGNATAHLLPADVARPAHDRGASARTIVHLGLGAFHRAHQAVYTDDANATGAPPWRIIGVSLRSPRVREQLAEQDGLFTVTSKGPEGAQTRLIGSLDRVLVAQEDPAEVIATLAAPDTLIVTLTVTEKGYGEAPDGTIDTQNPQIASDLSGAPPTSIYGLIEHALRARRDAGAGGLTLLSCDNLSHNGAKLRALLLDFLGRRDPSLAEWTDCNCQFPSSMVDRIVPATTDADLADLEARIGVRDAGAVFTEPFRQWVIEDRFGGARPAWEAGGAQFVTDVAPYETAKLRMLNGAHSALAYIGLERGHALVSEAIADPQIGALVERLMIAEAATSFTAAPGQDLPAYAASLQARFANPALPHRLAQIAADGSQKIVQRWLPVLAAHDNEAAQCTAILTALAAWVRHVRGDVGAVDDPQAGRLATLWAQAGPDGIVRALFGPGGVYAASWNAPPDALALLDSLVSTGGLSGD